MAYKFEQFRLSLMLRSQRDAFSGGDPTREEYLRSVFGKTLNYHQRKTNFRYIPSNIVADKPIVGELGREAVVRESAPTETGFEDQTHLGWKTCVIAIDPTDHADGQKVAVESNHEAGAASAIISSLVNAINNANPHTAYFIEVLPVVDGQLFWEFVAENEGRVTSVKFDLVVPNGLFSISNNVRDELEAKRDETAAREVSIGFSNKDGLLAHSPAIIDGVAYAETNGGIVRAKAKGGKRYNSTCKPKSVIINEDLSDEQEHLVVKVARLIVEIFGRE